MDSQGNISEFDTPVHFFTYSELFYSLYFIETIHRLSTLADHLRQKAHTDSEFQDYYLSKSKHWDKFLADIADAKTVATHLDGLEDIFKTAETLLAKSKTGMLGCGHRTMFVSSTSSFVILLPRSHTYYSYGTTTVKFINCKLSQTADMAAISEFFVPLILRSGHENGVAPQTNEVVIALTCASVAHHHIRK